MRRKKGVLTTLILLLIVLTSNITYANDSFNIDDINQVRSNLNLDELKVNQKLNETALSHSKYMVLNESFSSTEEEGKKYYRGRYPWDRTNYYDYFNPYVSEFISKDLNDYHQGIENFIYNPYTRIIWLDPIYKDIGIASEENMTTYILGGESRNKNHTVIYPYDGQTIPYDWKKDYSLEAYKDLDIDMNNIGLPITVSYYSDQLKIKEFVINQIEIKNVNTNEEIAYDVLKPGNDKYLNNSVIILPKDEYKPDTKYQLTIDMDIYFTNNKIENVAYEGEFLISNDATIEDYMTRVVFVERLIKLLDLPLVETIAYPFEDVNEQSNVSKYIYTAFENQLINGYPNHRFKPDQYINKEQIYVILIRAYEKLYGTLDNDESKHDIKDFDEISGWAKESILKANQLGFLVLNQSNFEPKSIIDYDDYNQIIEKFKLVIKINK